jgi:flagellar motor component MotA
MRWQAGIWAHGPAARDPDDRRCGCRAFILGNGIKTIKATLRVLPTLFKGSKYNKDVYMELMGLLYVLLAKRARKAR